MFAIRRIVGGMIAVSLVASFAGCPSSGSSSSGGTSMDSLASQADAQTAAKKQQDAAATAKAAADQKAATDASAAQAAEQEKKAVGSRPQPTTGGYYGAIMGARRHVMNVTDQISWIQGVRSFKAEEGRKPKDTNEFLKVVVTKYDLQLPRIEPDEEFVYDPNGETPGDFGQLYQVKKLDAPSEVGAAAAPAPPGTPPK